MSDLTDFYFPITRKVLIEKYDLKKSMESFLLFYIEKLTVEMKTPKDFQTTEDFYRFPGILYRNKETNKPMFFLHIEKYIFYVDYKEIWLPFIKEYKLVNRKTFTYGEVIKIVRMVYGKYFLINEYEIFSTSIAKLLKGDNE